MGAGCRLWLGLVFSVVDCCQADLDVTDAGGRSSCRLWIVVEIGGVLLHRLAVSVIAGRSLDGPLVSVYRLVNFCWADLGVAGSI